MKILALDASTKNFSLAAFDREDVACYRNAKLKHVLSSSIMPAIGAILKKAGWSLDDVDGFAVGLGPGAFTSLRVSVATVKGLAFASRKPVIGIASLDILAMGVKGDHAQICVITDARRGLVYACIYGKKGVRLKAKTRYLLTEIGDVLSRLNGEVIFVGDASVLCREVIRKKKGIVPVFVDERLHRPQVQRALPLVVQRAEAGRFDDLDRFVPLYLYPEDCQVRKK